MKGCHFNTAYTKLSPHQHKSKEEVKHSSSAEKQHHIQNRTIRQNQKGKPAKNELERVNSLPL